MNLISIVCIGFAMSTDAFSASIGKGIALRLNGLALSELKGGKGAARHKVKAVHAAYTQLIVGTEQCL